MRALLFVIAGLLIALGVGLYFGSGRESVTALIPAFVGAAFAICALVATTPNRRKHAMHVAALLALIGIGGSATGIPAAIRHLQGEVIERPEAAWGRSAMAILCLVFLVFAIRSFVRARRS